MDPIVWPLLLVIVLVGLLFMAMPGLTRPDVFFAVTVAPAFRGTPEGRRALGVYRLVSLASSLVAVGVLGLIAAREGMAEWSALALLPQILGAVAGFQVARQFVLPHAVAPAASREAVILRRRDTLPGGWPLQVIPFVVIATAAVVLAVRWSEVASRIPVHWALGGQVDRWADRTVSGVFAPLLLAGTMCGLFLAMSVGLLRSRRVRATGDGAPREDRFRRLTVLVLFVAEMLIALTSSQLALTVLVPVEAVGVAFTILLVGGLVVTLAIVVRLVRLGQGGTGGSLAVSEEAPIGDRTPDAAWKWGMFYLNPDDPALLVEKRFGIGYTFNFGHPMAWVLLGLVIAIPVLVGWLVS